MEQSVFLSWQVRQDMFVLRKLRFNSRTCGFTPLGQHRGAPRSGEYRFTWMLLTWLHASSSVVAISLLVHPCRSFPCSLTQIQQSASGHGSSECLVPLFGPPYSSSIFTTARMQSPAFMSSKAALISASFLRCVMNSSTLSRPSR